MDSNNSHTAPLAAPLVSLAFAKAYIITMRPYLLFVSGITGMLGLAFTHGLSAIPLLLIALAGFLAYGFGQALTDCTQIDTDTLSSPYRPLVQGKIGRAQVMIVSLVGLSLIGIIYVVREPSTLILTLAGTAGLASYTWFKRRWWGGPVWNALIVVDLAVISYFAASSTFVMSSLPRGFVPSLVAIFFGYANFVLSGYYKDIAADRATGYNTLPVTFGYKLSNIVSDIFSVITCAATLFVLVEFASASLLLVLPAAIAFAFGVNRSVQSQFRLHHVRHDDEAYKAIMPVVDTYILQLMAIILALMPSWWWLLALYYAAYALTMKLRPLNAQI